MWFTNDELYNSEQQTQEEVCNGTWPFCYKAGNTTHSKYQPNIHNLLYLLCTQK